MVLPSEKLVTIILNKYKATRLVLRPASPGTGVVAAGAVSILLGKNWTTF